MDEGMEMIDRTARAERNSSSSDESVRMRNRHDSECSDHEYWAQDKHSRAYVFKLFTCFYAIFIVIGGIVIELSNLISSEGTNSTIAHSKDLVLGIWLFGGSIVFIAYCAWLVFLEHRAVRAQRKSFLAGGTRLKEPEVLTNSNTGSLYLRLGCVVFGMIGVIYYGLIFVICTLGWSKSESARKGECSAISNSLNFLAAMFVFVQMWFVYCNGRIIFSGQGNLARFGLMHLVGTNLWMWLRYILYEEVETITEIRKAQNQSKIFHESPHHMHDIHATQTTLIQEHGGGKHFKTVQGHVEICQGVLCLFEGYSEFMFTCVVEYSLICAGVAFVFWTNIDYVKQEQAEKTRRKRNLITVDCSRTAEGLFAGFIFIIVTIIAIALFNAYSDKEVAQWIFLSTNTTFFLIATAICMLAFWRMKTLKFNEEKEGDDASGELLDRILLVVGLMGELVFSLGGLLSFVNNAATSNLAYLLFVSNITRLIQVTLQSGLIMVSSKLIINPKDPLMARYKPGKQVITLLLMMNCAQFLLNIFEAQTAGVDEEMIKMYGSYYWAVLIRGCSPLTIFFRFHSSACFAEIWKKTFRVHEKRRHTLEEERQNMRSQIVQNLAYPH